MRASRRRRYIVGPLLGPIPRGGGLLFPLPAASRERVGEPALKMGFSTSPDKILRAYKAKPAPGELSSEELAWGCVYWLLVESSAEDYMKHFRGSTRRGAYRVPRLLAKTCPRCGEPLYGDFCPECGERVEGCRYLEVWRDRLAVARVLGPFKTFTEAGNSVKFSGDGVEYEIPRIILHETILSVKPAGPLFYIRVLALERGGGGRATPSIP